MIPKESIPIPLRGKKKERSKIVKDTVCHVRYHFFDGNSSNDCKFMDRNAFRRGMWRGSSSEASYPLGGTTSSREPRVSRLTIFPRKIRAHALRESKFHRSRARYTSQVIYSLSWRTRSDVQAFVRAASHYSYIYASETGGRAGRQARIGKNRPRWLFRRRKSPGRLWWIARGVLLAAGVSDSFLFSFFVSSRSFALLSFSLSLSFSVFLLLPTFFCKHRLGWSDKREHARDGRLLQ